MKSIIFTATALASFLGCSTVPRHEVRHAGTAGADLRGETPVHAARPKALISGPAILKHVETSGDGTITLYLVDDPGIADRRCPSAGAEQVEPLAVLARSSRITDVAVPPGKRVCATVAEARAMSVSWHAQPAVAPTADGDHALNLALLGR